MNLLCDDGIMSKEASVYLFVCHLFLSYFHAYEHEWFKRCLQRVIWIHIIYISIYKYTHTTSVNMMMTVWEMRVIWRWARLFARLHHTTCWLACAHCLHSSHSAVLWVCEFHQLAKTVENYHHLHPLPICKHHKGSHKTQRRTFSLTQIHFGSFTSSFAHIKSISK